MVLCPFALYHAGMGQFNEQWRKDGLTSTQLSAAVGVNAEYAVRLPGIRKNVSKRYTPAMTRKIAVARTKLVRGMKEAERQRWNKLLKFLKLPIIPKK